MIWAPLFSLFLFSAATLPLVAQKTAAPVKSLRVYLFDCGLIKGEKPTDYGLKNEDVKNPDMVVPCYLIVHPKGTLMWDVGVIPDSAFKGGKPAMITDGSDIETSPRPLLPQLAALGYPPQKITYLALSHMHSDHTANANAFAGSTWLVHASERDAMFAVSPKNQASYSELRHSKTIILPNADYDVFGDGTVVIKYTPGHTPGHQVLALKLPKTGPVVIGGDLWHYVAEKTSPHPPHDEANPQQTMASRQAINAYIKQTGAQLWIEHDPVTFARLPKAPDYIE
jgi:glyoxylase-like metal-dependent hydrolase (beta-lactamase superfamily II)